MQAAILGALTPEETQEWHAGMAQAVAEDFLYSCAYCTMTETEARGIGFNIDHYMPQEHYPESVSDYANLMWSCEGCNWYKAGYPEPGREIGWRRVIKADAENPRQHLSLEDGSSRLTHRTPTGEFNVQLLRLNRYILLRLREARRKLWASNEFIAHGMSELLNIPLDLLDKRYRAPLLRLQQRLGREYRGALTSVKKFIEDAAKSELLDPEPDRAEQLRARREYLRSVGAVDPRLVATLGKRSKRPKGRKKKPRRQR